MNYGQRNTSTRLKEETGYKYVYPIINRSGIKCYEAKVRINGKDTHWYFDNARDAAKKVDLELIKAGKKPINGILSKK